MKKHISLFCLLLTLFAVCLPTTSFAQQPGNEYAIFNWRNDGDFNAFLNCDVDSITYSKVDLDGRIHHNAVVQEVWTPDSVYRIPIAAIDSIAFRAPDPILKEGIFHITEWHFPYVTDVNDSTALTITFNASIPSDSLPSEGQVVITDVYEGLLENGFAGRVTRKVSLGENVQIECEDVTIEDIYDQLICVGKTAIICDDNTSLSQAPRRDNKDGVIHLNLGEISLELKKLKLRIAPIIDIDYTIRYVNGQKKNYKVVAHNNLDCHVDIGHEFFDNDIIQLESDEPLFEIDIPTKLRLLHLHLEFGGYFNMKGTGSIYLSVPFTLNNNIGYDSQNNRCIFNFKGSEIKPISIDASFEAEASFGLKMKIDSYFISKKFLHANFTLKAGPKYSGELNFSSTYNQSTSWDDFKDTKISVTPLSLTFTDTVNVFGIKANREHTLSIPEIDCYLFPNFTAPALPSLNANGLSLTALTTDISRWVMFPVTPGIGLFDNNNHLVDTIFSSKQYLNPESWDKKDLQMELLQKYPTGTYTAYPIFKSRIFRTVMALPTSEATIPEPLSTEDSVLFLKEHNAKDIQINGGWGSYTLSNHETGVVYARFVSRDGELIAPSWQPTNGFGYENEIPRIRIKGLKTGNATITLKDMRSGEEVAINVFVNETGDEPSITTSEDQLNFGNVLKDNPKTETFIVTGSNLVGNLTLSSSNPYFTVSPTNITKEDAANEVTVTVTYCPASAGNHSGAITISSDGVSKTVSVSGTCVVPTISVSPEQLSFGNVTVGKTVSKTFTVTGTNTVGDITFTVQNTSTHGNFSISPQTLPASGGTVTVTCAATSAGDISGRILVSSTGADDETVTLTGTAVNPPPVITVSTTSLDFGSVLRGNTVQKTFTVTGLNLTGDLTLSSNNSYFTVSPTSITKANAANGVTVTVTYKPTAGGNHSGNITVSGGEAASKTVSLSGTCIQPVISVSPEQLSFGNVTVGKTVSKTFTVTGTNTVGDITFTVQNTSTHGNFSISPQTMPASGGTVTVTCAATSAGDINGRILVSSTGADDEAVTLTGTAVNPPPVITVSPTSLAFGRVAKGKTVQKTFTVTGLNLTGDLTLSSNNSYFTVSPTSITKANAANGVTVTVTYKPTAGGNHSGSITVSGGGAASKTVSLSGTCVQPVISVSPEQLSFGNVTVGKTVSKTITVTGTNTVGDITFTMQNTSTHGNFSISPETLPASGGTVTVTCAATSAGDINGRVLVSSTGADDEAVTLTGTAVNPPPVITVSPTSLAFGRVAKGKTVQKTFTVYGSNLTGNLTVSSNNSNFTVSPTSITKANAANGVTVTVTYKPTAAGSHSGNITVSGGGAADKTVSLSGTCVVPTISVSTNTLDFGSTRKGRPLLATFTVTGTNTVDGISLTLENTCTCADFTISPQTLPASGGTVTVTGTTSATGNISGRIRVSSTGASDQLVTLTGTVN